MKTFLTLFLIFTSALLFSEESKAASTTVQPFSMQFYVMENRFSIKPKVILSCRYEKIPTSDSAEYYTETKNFDLDIEATPADGNVFYKLSLKNKKFLEVKGVFKPTKECMSELEIEFVDNNYSVGWAAQYKRPVKFTLQSDGYFQSGDTVADFSKIFELIDLSNLDFLYKSVPGLQVNIWMISNNKKLPLSPVSVAIDPETNMPYKLEK